MRTRSRKPLSVSLWVVSGLLISVGALVGLSHGTVVRSAENSAEILASFRQAAEFVDDFKAREARLPSQEEYSALMRTHSDASRDLLRIEVETGQYSGAPGSKDAASKLGSVPEGAYYLTYWRGEWLEYYAGWSGKTTLSLRPRDYYVLGSPILDAGMWWLAGLFSGFLARQAWARSPEVRSRPTA